MGKYGKKKGHKNKPKTTAAIKKYVKKEVRHEAKAMVGGPPTSMERSHKIRAGIRGLGKRVRVAGPLNRGEKRGTYKRVRFSGQDIIAAAVVGNSALGFRTVQIPVNPVQMPSLRLNILSQLYERYQFQKLSFQFRTAVGTTTAGKLYHFYDDDINDLMLQDITSNIPVSVTHPKAKDFAVWKDNTMTVRPTLAHETEYYVDNGAPSRQNTQGVYQVLVGSGATSTTSYGDIVCKWTIDFWVDVVEANQAQTTGAAIGAEFAMSPQSLVNGVNMNTLSPLAISGQAIHTAPWGGTGGDVLVSGSLPGVTFAVPGTNPGTSIQITTTQPAVYVFVQQISDTVLFAGTSVSSTYNLVAQTNTSTLLNIIQSGGSTGLLGIHVWSQGSLLLNGIRQLGYASTANFTWASTSLATKRSWLFKMPSFTAVRPRTDADILERKVLDRVNRMMMSSAWGGPQPSFSVRDETKNAVVRPLDMQNTFPAPIDEKSGVLVDPSVLSAAAAKQKSRQEATRASLDGAIMKIVGDDLVVVEQPRKRTPTPIRTPNARASAAGEPPG